MEADGTWILRSRFFTTELFQYLPPSDEIEFREAVFLPPRETAILEEKSVWCDLTYETYKGVRHGEFRLTLLKTRRIYQQGAYKDGKRHGRFETYDEKGRLIARCVFKDGTYEGPYETWNDHRKTKFFVYKNNIMDGPFKRYYMNGRLLERFMYKNGKADGLYEKYHKNGQIALRGMLKDGNAFEVYGAWDKKGNKQPRGNTPPEGVFED